MFGALGCCSFAGAILPKHQVLILTRHSWPHASTVQLAHMHSHKLEYICISKCSLHTMFCLTDSSHFWEGRLNFTKESWESWDIPKKLGMGDGERSLPCGMSPAAGCRRDRKAPLVRTVERLSQASVISGWQAVGKQNVRTCQCVTPCEPGSLQGGE